MSSLSLFAVLVVFGIVIVTSPDERFSLANSPVAYIFVFLLILMVIGLFVVTLLSFSLHYKGRSLADRDGKSPSSSAKSTAKVARFPSLLDIDKAHKRDFEEVPLPSGLTLSSLCVSFRDYCAGSLSLYYTERDVRRFVSSLCTGRLIVLQGMSGTGKTSLAVAWGKFVSSRSSVVPVQPMWKERSDLLGYYNEFTGRFSETPILERLYDSSFTDSVSLIVLDELNIARVEYYFSEFLSLLELPDASDRALVVASSGALGDPRHMAKGRIELPDGVWFVGTANNDDSTFALSDKVYDRAMCLDLDSRAEPFRPASSPKPIRMGSKALMGMAERARAEMALTRRGLRRIGELDSYLQASFHVTFGNR